jgi:hypothetical protein
MKKTGRKKKKSTSSTYTTGNLNRIVDNLFHPFFKTNIACILIDGILHGVVERNPKKTIKKFARYNLPKIIKYILDERK